MRSAWRPRPAICGRTSSAESRRFPTCFSLGFTPSPSDSLIGIPASFGPFFRCAFSCPTSVRREGRSYRFCRLVDDIVYDSIFLSLLRVHNEVALDILFDLVQFLSAVLRE